MKPRALQLQAKLRFMLFVWALKLQRRETNDRYKIKLDIEWFALVLWMCTIFRKRRLILHIACEAERNLLLQCALAFLCFPIKVVRDTTHLHKYNRKCSWKALLIRHFYVRLYFAFIHPLCGEQRPPFHWHVKSMVNGTVTVLNSDW